MNYITTLLCAMIACVSLQVMAQGADTITPKQPPADQNWGCGDGKAVVKNLVTGATTCPVNGATAVEIQQDECDGEGCAGVLSDDAKQPPK